MILADPPQATAVSAPSGRATLDDLFRHAALRRPDAIALVDPLNRQSFTEDAPRRLTYAEADRMISAVAGRLRRLGLPTDTIVGIQLPNTVESVLTLLGVVRAGMIAAPLPLLWRRNEMVNALSRLGAKILITCGRVGAVDHAELAMRTAAEIFPIRYVCAFGRTLPDGVVPLDDLFTEEKLDRLPPAQRERGNNPAAHLAVITWDAASDGPVPVARNHMEIIAGGVAIFLESRCRQDARFLSTLAASSFAGLVLTLMPWLLTGGTLTLHQPFDIDSFATQLEQDRCDTVVLPESAASQLADAGYFAGAGDLKTVMALGRSPEKMGASPVWSDKNVALVDVVAFGEIAVIPARRGVSGKPVPIPFGSVTAPRDAAGALPIAELSRTEAGTIALRGPMIPRYAFPPGAERGTAPYFKVVADLVDTGYTCRVDRDTGAMVVTGPPVGILGVGGYRFALRNLEDLVSGIEPGAGIATLPDPLCGQRLSGSATNAEAVRTALARRDVNPLIVGAFAKARKPSASTLTGH